MTTLLDANVLIAIATPSHVHHAAAETWFSSLDGGFATCPITQGALMRLILRTGGTRGQALAVLSDLVAAAQHSFWPDDVGYDAIRLEGVMGHGQLTDAYLAGLARSRRGALATFDRGLAALHGDVAVRVPTQAQDE